MGHFSATCAGSDLAIPGGTPIRACLLTENPYGEGWDLRAPPIRARYNDYGNIEAVPAADTPICDLWLKGLEIDLIERGTGDNTIHDVATRTGMSFDQLCDALRAGRVLVRQDTKHFWMPPIPDDSPTEQLLRARREAETWRPTLVSVERALGDLKDKVHIDAPLGNVVRIRSAGYGDDQPVLDRARAACDTAGLVAVIAAGSGNYARQAEVLVFAAPGADRHFAGPIWQAEDEQHLTVSWAFVREDVWQELLAVKRVSWSGPDTLEAVAERVRTAWAKLQDRRGDRLFLGLASDVQLVKHVAGVIGLGEHLALLAEQPPLASPARPRRPSASPINHVLQAVAEMLHIHWHQRSARRAWAPLNCLVGSQDPEWDAHVRYLAVVKRVAMRELRAAKETQK